MPLDVKPTQSHCPFGCKLEELDEYGYCDHLIGFTSDNKTFEPLSTRADGRPMVSSPKRGQEPEKILPGDHLVNPEVRQLQGQVFVQAKAWVSSRVYRERPAKPRSKNPAA